MKKIEKYFPYFMLRRSLDGILYIADSHSNALLTLSRENEILDTQSFDYSINCGLFIQQEETLVLGVGTTLQFFDLTNPCKPTLKKKIQLQEDLCSLLQIDEHRLLIGLYFKYVSVFDLRIDEEIRYDCYGGDPTVFLLKTDKPNFFITGQFSQIQFLTVYPKRIKKETDIQIL